MSDEKKEKDSTHPARSTDPERDERRHPETNFLPPLKMFLAFFDRESRQKKKRKGANQDLDEKDVEKLIEKLSESEAESKQDIKSDK